MKRMFYNYIENENSFDKITKLGIICLIIVISGIFGFVYEFIFYYFNSGMRYFYWQGGNFLPWINIYAIGSIIIYLAAYKERKSPGKVFFLSLFLCGIIEYIAGIGMYIIGNGFRCWDYNTEILNWGNIGGFVCLRSVLFFGFSGLLLVYFVIPLCFFLAQKMKKKHFLIFSFTLCSLFLIDEIYNLLIARIFVLPRASDIYKGWGIKYMTFK